MKRYILMIILAFAVALCLGCNDDSSSPAPSSDGGASAGAPTGPGMAPGAPSGPGMPGSPSAMPGAPAGPGMPGSPSAMPGAPAGPGMPGSPSAMPDATGMPGAPGMAGQDMGGGVPADEAPANDLKTLESENPNATVKRDDSGELRSFYNPDAKVKTKTTPLTELQAREEALSFIRANYYYFDSMSFEFRPAPGSLQGGVYSFKWTQIIRETKKTGNVINISVNPYSGKVVKYNSTRNNWDN